MGGDGTVIAYGSWGHPVLIFPAEGGSAVDLENNGIIHVLAPAIEAGKIKVYTVDARDSHAWSNRSLPLEARAHNYAAYLSWITDQVAPAIHWDCGGRVDISTVGASMGAYHAVNAALKRADLFPHAVGMSGNYDPTTWHGWGDCGDAVYFNNPFAYLPNEGGDHLDWLRGRVTIDLDVGTGAFEVEPTQSLPSTKALADLLWSKGIRCRLDVWGDDTPHDWPSWQRMIVKHFG